MVTIVISTYNRASTLPKAIKSALNQTYKDIEILVVDDASTDNTEEVVKSFNDSRIRYIKHNTNIGIAPTWKKAFLEYARGDFITVLNDDDRFILDTFIEDAIKLFKKHQIVAVFSRFIYKTTDKIIDVYKDKFPEFIKGLDLFLDKTLIESDNGVIYKREVLNKLDLFNLNLSSLDIELVYKLMLVGDLGFLDKITYEHIIHNDSYSLVDLKNLHKIIVSGMWIEEVYNLGLKLGIDKKILDKFKEEKSFEWWKRRINSLHNNMMVYIQNKLDKLQYLEKEVLFFQFNEFIDKLKLLNLDKIYIYGAGEGARRIYEELNSEVIAFIDDNQEGEKFGIPIIKPHQIDKDYPIVISINYTIIVHKIVNNLRKLGIKNEIYDFLLSVDDKCLYHIPFSDKNDYNI